MLPLRGRAAQDGFRHLPRYECAQWPQVTLTTQPRGPSLLNQSGPRALPQTRPTLRIDSPQWLHPMRDKATKVRCTALWARRRFAAGVKAASAEGGWTRLLNAWGFLKAGIIHANTCSARGRRARPEPPPASHERVSLPIELRPGHPTDDAAACVRSSGLPL